MALGNSALTRVDLPASVETLCSQWTGNGSGDAVKVFGPQAEELDRTAQGKYTLHLSAWGQTLVGVRWSVGTATGAANKKSVNWTVGSSNSTARTVDLEVFDAATPTLQDLASGDVLTLYVDFARTEV